MIKPPLFLMLILVAMGALYGASFWVMVKVDEQSAWSRFDALDNSGAHGRAAAHGHQALALWAKHREKDHEYYAYSLRVAEAHRLGNHPQKAIALYTDILNSFFMETTSFGHQMLLKNRLAMLHLTHGEPVVAGTLLAELVDAAGDDAARLLSYEAGLGGQDQDLSPLPPKDKANSLYLDYVNEAIGGFVDAFPPIVSTNPISGDTPERLFAAEQLTTLGGYYGRIPQGEYASAGLLATAYQTRLELLGADHDDTVHTGLILAPIYEKIDRAKNAETIYLEIFHAQERVKGSNNPELSLYIRLLTDIYQRQGRMTEAEALNIHMRTIFRDAFGARRYAVNKNRDRRSDMNRPVSADFPLPPSYTPENLVFANVKGIEVSKSPDIEEMMIRSLTVSGEGDDVTMASLLRELLQSCQTNKERLSLRSGYRSYATQKALYDRLGHWGKIAKAGTSEHQLGLAVDIDVNGRFMRSTDRSYKCFKEQAWQYGFILTYPRGNTYLEAEDSFEPWHWRFVGPQTALLYREIGPVGYPQEFLAALPCYEERALSGLYISAEEDDICIENMITPRQTTPLKGDPSPATAQMVETSF